MLIKTGQLCVQYCVDFGNFLVSSYKQRLQHFGNSGLSWILTLLNTFIENEVKTDTYITVKQRSIYNSVRQRSEMFNVWLQLKPFKYSLFFIGSVIVNNKWPLANVVMYHVYMLTCPRYGNIRQQEHTKITDVSINVKY